MQASKSFYKNPIILATRASVLALYQANLVKSLLEEKHTGLKIELLSIKTSGDIIQDRPLREVGGKALFLKEIEEALLQKKADFAVHSLKDVPALLPNGLKLGVVLEREEACDILISPAGLTIEQLPQNAKVGTSSLRRKVQLLKQRPDLQILELRGNVDTRIRKLKEGVYDAIILAYAGVKRLNLLDKISYQKLNFIASPGQGAIAIEYREQDLELEKLLQSLDHSLTHQGVKIERLFLKHFEASCDIPLGAQVEKLNDTTFRLNAFLSDAEGKEYLEGSKEGSLDQLEILALDLIEDFKK